MKKNINLIGIALLMLSFFAFSGFSCGNEGGIKLRVIGSGNFDGYYIIDGGNDYTNGKEGTIRGDQDNNYRYEKSLGTFKHIEISIKKDISNSTMDIYLFEQNGDVIQRVTNAACEPSSATTCINSSSMSYTSTTGQH